MKSKLTLLVFVSVLLIFIGVFTDRKWFVEKVIYPITQRFIERRFMNGESLFVSSTRIDSVWRVGVKNIIFINSVPSMEKMKVIDNLFISQLNEYNHETSLIITTDIDNISNFIQKYNLTYLLLRGQEKNMFFIQNVEDICIVSVEKEKKSYKLTIKERF